MLVQRGLSFILSYDGRTGRKSHGDELPAELGLTRVEIKAGRSAQSTLLGRNDMTYESIYLSQELARRATAGGRTLMTERGASLGTQLTLLSQGRER